MKYLGVVLDQHLKWTAHIEYLTTKIRKLIHKFYIIREFLSAKLVVQVYKSLVESLMRYGLAVWGGTYKTNLQPLRIIQNYILKVSYKRDRLYPTRLLYNENVNDLDVLYIQSLCKFVHQKKVLQNHISHAYSTRQNINNHLTLPPNHRTINMRHATYLAPKVYNLLPNCIKQITRNDIFAKKSKLYIFENRDIFAEVSYKKYKEARNCVVSVIRQEKRRYFQEKVDESKNDSSKMWDALKLILDSNKNFQKIKEIHFNDDIVNSESKLPSRLNAYYISSIEEIITGINYININANVNKELAGVSTLSCFTMIDESILKNIIFSLENKNSPDEINDKLLKNIYPTIEKPLINLINSSLEQGIFPDVLKMSTVIPIQKKENAVNASDLRPINTLPIIEKILEKVVYAQLLEFIVKNNIISKHQSGFRKGHSCETAIQCVLDDWKNWADDGYSVMAVFLDLQRAFETIDRKKLLSKLEFIGIRGNVKKWFQSYLNNRMQCVKLNGFTSNEILNEYGVPQGSVLGPILFVLYINDMVDIMDNVSIHLFADDTLIYYYSKDLDQLVHCINNSLEKIHNYTCSNLLKINAKKTKFMLISKERVKEEFVANSYKIEINNEQIEQVKKIKYLGVIIDDKLLFKEHCNYMVSKISYAINYMSRCSSTLSVWSRKIIFNTLILPHFNYCATIMYLFQQNEIGRLQKLQNRAMRIILSCNRYASINTMLSSLQWLPVSLYIKYNVLVFIFKVKTGSAPSYLTSKLTYNNEIHQYNTRQQNNFFIPPRNKKIGTNSVFHKGLNDFNKLPNTIKDCSSILTFKKELKMYLLREAYLYQG